MDFEVRKATFEDREAITQLIGESARGLSREHYDDAQIEGAIARIFGVDSSLIEDSTYFVADQNGTLIGCGGWSKRNTLYGGDQFSSRDTGMLDSATHPAKIRAFFVHPEHARKGVARAILSVCEQEARAHGFAALELMATLPGIKFYEANGYSATEDFDLELEDGVKLQFVLMRKQL
jgi:GNAT superfamily N-acetyltransferase